MAKSRSSPIATRVFTQLAFMLVGALLTGFLTVFFAKFLGHFVSHVVAAPLGVGIGVSLTLWFTQLLKHPPYVLGGTSPLVAGFCAALGVHVARVWLS